jgi:hypothetical protein
MTDDRGTSQESRARALRLYLHVIVGAGGLVLLHSAIAAARTPHPLGWLTLAALAMVAGSFRLNFASVSANISIADTFFMTSALLFGPGPVTVSMAAAGFFISWRRRKPYRQSAFNTAAPALSIWAGAQTFFWIAGVPPLTGATSAVGGLIVPLLALTIVYFVQLVDRRRRRPRPGQSPLQIGAATPVAIAEYLAASVCSA